MAKGTVKRFNNAKGFGFIQQDEGPDVFVNLSSITEDGFKTLMEGQRVSFDVENGGKWPAAARVAKL